MAPPFAVTIGPVCFSRIGRSSHWIIYGAGARTIRALRIDIRRATYICIYPRSRTHAHAKYLAQVTPMMRMYMCVSVNRHTYTHLHMMHTQVQESITRDAETDDRAIADYPRTSRVVAHVWKLTASHSVTHLREYTEGDDGREDCAWTDANTILGRRYTDAKMKISSVLRSILSASRIFFILFC